MCQPATGKVRVLKERTAWKVTREGDLSRGPHHDTQFQKNGWSKRVTPRVGLSSKLTRFGYHVLRTQKDAEKYLRNEGGWKYSYYTVTKVKIRGKAIPFKSSEGWSGWAVAQWKVAD